jgi:hypothetical protein
MLLVRLDLENELRQRTHRIIFLHLSLGYYLPTSGYYWRESESDTRMMIQQALVMKTNISAGKMRYKRSGI